MTRTAPNDTTPAESLTPAHVLRAWWPLAASWLLMGAEGPVVTGFLGRAADSKVHLAAFSAAFNVALVVEAPIIMLLAASTALAVDRAAYRTLQRYMFAAALGLTLLHGLIAFTPVFDLVAGTLLELHEDLREPTRLALKLLLPWTGAIAYRRFQQGVLIRTGHPRRVLAGTALRLVTGFATISLGHRFGWPGVVLGATTLSVGVLVEAVFAWAAVRGPRVERLPERAPHAAPVRLLPFLAFYLPLAATPLLVLGVQPLGTATMTRMPSPRESLASYHGVHSLVFLTRSVGFAFNEVVVSLLGRPGSVDALLRFAKRLGAATVGVLALLAFTPLGALWFRHAQSFDESLVPLATGALVVALVMPANQVLQSWFGGVLVKSGRTRGITEAVLLYAVVAAGLLRLGVELAPTNGLVWTVGSLATAGLAQAGWLALRARPQVAGFRAGEFAPLDPAADDDGMIPDDTPAPPSTR